MSEIEALLNKNGFTNVSRFSQHDHNNEIVQVDINGKYLIALAQR
jgi:hypothetical protein